MVKEIIEIGTEKILIDIGTEKILIDGNKRKIGTEIILIDGNNKNNMYKHEIICFVWFETESGLAHNLQMREYEKGFELLGCKYFEWGDTQIFSHKEYYDQDSEITTIYLRDLIIKFRHKEEADIFKSIARSRIGLILK